MGCGASQETHDESQAKKTQRESAAVESCSTQARVNRSTADATPAGAATPNVNPSLSPGSNALSTSNPNMNNSFSSSINSQSNPGIAMPTHTVVDSSGHKVSSCISSRSKVDTVTRWLDHIIRHRYDNGGWKNPQDEPPKEVKDPKEIRPPCSTASQGSAASDSVTRMAGSPTMEYSTASASQLSLGVPMTPAGEVGSNMAHRPMSTTPFSPWTDISNQNDNSPADRQLEWHTPHGNKTSATGQPGNRPPDTPPSPQRSSLQGQPVAVTA